MTPRYVVVNVDRFAPALLMGRTMHMHRGAAHWHVVGTCSWKEIAAAGVVVMAKDASVVVDTRPA